MYLTSQQVIILCGIEEETYDTKHYARNPKHEDDLLLLEQAGYIELSGSPSGYITTDEGDERVRKMKMETD